MMIMNIQENNIYIYLFNTKESKGKSKLKNTTTPNMSQIFAILKYLFIYLPNFVLNMN